ncbi:DUF6883 domain-containing protein [Deltaproteobacteria bacterium TL4]
MKIPYADRAVVHLDKLIEYCLNPNHRTGKNKAHVFESVFGLTAEDAEILKEILLKAIPQHEAKIGLKDQYGQRYQVDLPLKRKGKQAIIRSAWIIETDKPYPRLTSCYVLEEE